MSEHQDGFYVGYLPIPRRHLVFLWIMTPLVAAALGSLAGVFSAAQRDPGDGVWDTGSPVAVTGTLLAEPYPMIVDDEARTHLLVNVGKSAPTDRVAPFVRQRVTVTGYQLERQGRRMLELVEGEDAVVTSEGVPGWPFTTSRTGGTVILEGEILDSKCYLGAMKPGDGKGHKACATLCIEGGIPPLLLVWPEDTDSREMLLLVDSQWDGASDIVLDAIGEPVRMTGTLGNVGDLPVFAIQPGSLERLSR